MYPESKNSCTFWDNERGVGADALACKIACEPVTKGSTKMGQCTPNFNLEI